MRYLSAMKIIPLSKTTFEQALSEACTLDDYLNGMHTIERCFCLVFARLLQDGSPSPALLEQKLAAFVLNVRTIKPSELNQLLKTVLSLSVLRAIEGWRNANDLELFGDMSAMDTPWLDHKGCWKSGWEREYLNPLQERDFERFGLSSQTRVTSEQGRILDGIFANIDEHMDIQGLAGTGKTYLIAKLLEVVPATSTLILTMNAEQKRVIEARFPKGVNVQTVGEICFQLIRQNLFTQKQFSSDRTRQSYFLPPKVVIEKLGLQDRPNFSVFDQIKVIQRTANNFCFSPKMTVQTLHIPYRQQYSEAYQQVIVGYARRLLKMTFEPDPEDPKPMPFRAYHAIKLVQLNSIPFPNAYTHILFDEAHDMNGAIRKILSAAPQACISLGDSYQRLNVKSVNPGFMDSHVRRKAMGASYRAGSHADEVYNSIIQAHSYAGDTEFQGAKTIDTRIKYYDQPSIPQEPATLMARDAFGAFLMANTLVENRASVYVLPRTLKEFQYLMNEAMSLYEGTLSSPSHPMLRGCASWDDALKRNASASLKQISRLFESGFNAHKLGDFYLNLSAQYSENCYVVCRIEDAKGHQFNRAFLFPDGLIYPPRNELEKEDILNFIYTGASRGRHELILPGVLKDWLQDLSKLSFKAS